MPRLIHVHSYYVVPPIRSDVDLERPYLLAGACGARLEVDPTVRPKSYPAELRRRREAREWAERFNARSA